MDWTNWCRLCGSCEVMIEIDVSSTKMLQQVCMIPETNNMKVCQDCYSILSELETFVAKTKVVSELYQELESKGDYLNFDTVNELRSQYGLDLLEGIIVESVNEDNFIMECQTDEVETEYIEEVIKIDEVIKMEEVNFSDESWIEENYEEEDEDSEYLEEHLVEYEGEETETTEHSEKSRIINKNDDEIEYDFQCHICHLKYVKMCFLSSHTRHVHNCLPQVKCLCGKILGTWKGLMLHRKKHYPEKVEYECKECNKGYQLKVTYETHMRTKHGPLSKKLACSQCGKVFAENRKLLAHEKTHLPDELKRIFSCEWKECHKKFTSIFSLRSHVKTIHENPDIFTCELCGRGFTRKTDLKSHMSVHTSERRFQCKVCMIKVKTAGILRKHMTLHSPSATSEVYPCHICQREFRTKNLLKNHSVLHSDRKDFQCPICPKAYKRKKDLTCHQSVHTGDPLYSCQFCERKFVNNSNMRKHKLKEHLAELEEWEAVNGKPTRGLGFFIGAN